jgi:2-polyprenyl-3-methyl-5-hydroxy-6-metoxy-1,4-benzoquinol methylase
MNNAIKKKWNQIYLDANHVQYPVASVLLDHCFLLPRHGVALDLASGLGSNAFYLAELGLQVHAWDISSVAIKKIQQHTRYAELHLEAQEKLIEPAAFEKQQFDVIVVSRFLERSCCAAIMDALKPGGLLFFQTYTFEKVAQEGPKNPDFLLAENELLQLFNALKVVFYQENALLGDLQAGVRNEAQFIGCKT